MTGGGGHGGTFSADSDGSGDRPTFARYREWMSARGFRPSRRLGQNFLLDPSLHRALIAEMDIRSSDVVLELGAGLGFLTRELCAKAGSVVAVEIDSRLCDILRTERSKFPEEGKNLRLIEGDALDGDQLSIEAIAEVARECERLGTERWLCAANLPYSIAGPILAAMALAEAPADTAALMVQYELGQRIAAEASQSEYGGLSVLVQAVWEVRIARRIGREVFRPRPLVDSAILVLSPRPDGIGGRPLAERRAFATWIRRVFRGRRKRIATTLTAVAGEHRDQALARISSDHANSRPDGLTWREHLAVWEAIRGFV